MDSRLPCSHIWVYLSHCINSSLLPGLHWQPELRTYDSLIWANSIPRAKIYSGAGVYSMIGIKHTSCAIDSKRRSAFLIFLMCMKTRRSPLLSWFGGPRSDIPTGWREDHACLVRTTAIAQTDLTRSFLKLMGFSVVLITRADSVAIVTTDLIQSNWQVR